MDSTIQLGITI